MASVGFLGIIVRHLEKGKLHDGSLEARCTRRTSFLAGPEVLEITACFGVRQLAAALSSGERGPTQLAAVVSP